MFRKEAFVMLWPVYILGLGLVLSFGRGSGSRMIVVGVLSLVAGIMAGRVMPKLFIAVYEGGMSNVPRALGLFAIVLVLGVASMGGARWITMAGPINRDLALVVACLWAVPVAVVGGRAWSSWARRGRYDLQRMKTDLAVQLRAYLDGQLDLDALKRYAWAQEQTWETVDDLSLPVATDDDRVYWAAIWDIINAGDVPPEHHPTLEDLRLHLASLRGEATLPASVHAARPCGRS